MTARTLTAMAVLVALAGQAAGQNALGNGTEMGNRILGDRVRDGLGDGRGLDLNTQVGSNGRNNQVRNFQAEMSFRNSIVTGNAPNGLSFRGDLPYFAPTEFRGNTGSNDLYSYRRDSLYSGLAGMGIRGTEALQQQFALTAGNRLPELITGSLMVNRFGAGDADFASKLKTNKMGLAPSGDPATISRIDPTELQPDFSGLTLGATQELGTLRSTSAYTSTRGVQPTLLDIRTTPNQDLIGVSASTLRGIQSIPLGKATADNSVAGVKNTLAGGAGTIPGGSRPTVPNPSGTPSNPIVGAKPMTEAAIGNNAYLDLMSRLTTYAGATPATGTDTRPEWQKQIDALRSDLNASDLGVGPDPAAVDPAGTGLPSTGVGAEPAFTPTAIAPLPPVKNFRFDPTTVDTLRNASGQISSLVPLTDTTSGAYVDHMRIGQEELVKGRYFDAEEEFTRAVASKPDDAMALVGRVHAQLGAGTNLSAWMNLRELFKNHPELLGAKYDARLLPESKRLREVVTKLRSLIEDRGPLHREAAMLLAYLGYQSGDTKALGDGLAAMDQAKDGQADALTDLMAAVWSGQAPAPAPVVPAEAQPGDPLPMVEPQK